ncbi:MAG: hypothetical protein OXG04_09165 [Acidobacteria bacterium]|nr:hypothetical protein [Acidobacteriota bacterium]
MYERVMDAELLVLDDIGAEPRGPNGSWRLTGPDYRRIEDRSRSTIERVAERMACTTSDAS